MGIAFGKDAEVVGRYQPPSIVRQGRRQHFYVMCCIFRQSIFSGKDCRSVLKAIELLDERCRRNVRITFHWALYVRRRVPLSGKQESVLPGEIRSYSFLPRSFVSVTACMFALIKARYLNQTLTLLVPRSNSRALISMVKIVSLIKSLPIAMDSVTRFMSVTLRGANSTVVILGLRFGQISHC